MKKLLCIFIMPIILLSINPSFAGQVYTWTDENGVTHISDTPRKQVSKETINTKPQAIKKPISRPKEESCYSLADKFDFRKVKWGMTRNQVELIEKDLNFRKGITSFGYNIGECVRAEIKSFNRKMVLSYTFLKDKLVFGECTYLGKFNKNSDQKIYKEFKSKLISRHGRPITEDQFVNSREYFSMWENDTSKIFLRVEQIPYVEDYSCEISYNSKNHGHLISEAEAEANRRTNDEGDKYFIEFEAESSIKPYCKKEWPTDYEMQKYCVDEQIKALAQLLEEKPDDVPSKIFDGIREKCKEDWPNNYKMWLYCEKKQIRAWRDLN